MRKYFLKNTSNSPIKKISVKKKKKSWIVNLNAWLHLWPSIFSGIIVVFVCLTGTLIVYCDEILDWSAEDAKYVMIEKEKENYDALLKSINKKDPNLELSEMVFFKDPTRSIRVRVFNNKTDKLAYLYLNPYTTQVLKIDYTAHFFYVTAHLHSSLLAGNIGAWIVLMSTIILFISCLTGLILWWPKRWTKKTIQDSVTVKWEARFKRLNYDLHNVYGFYSLLLCFILSITGILIFFHSLEDLVTKSFGGADGIEEVVSVLTPDQKSVDLVTHAYKAFDKNPQSKSAAIWLYNLDEIGVFIYRMGVTGLKSSESLELAVYNRYTGTQLFIAKPQIIHEKVQNIIWQLHMGQWWGQLGKISTFLAGIIATSLPITGFLIWWGRKKKNRTT